MSFAHLSTETLSPKTLSSSSSSSSATHHRRPSTLQKNIEQLSHLKLKSPTICIRPPTAKNHHGHHNNSNNNNGKEPRRDNDDDDGDAANRSDNDDDDDVDAEEDEEEEEDGGTLSFGMLGMLGNSLKVEVAKSKKTVKERRSNSFDGALRLYSKKNSKLRRKSEVP